LERQFLLLKKQKPAIIFEIMSRNLINLFTVLAVLFIITACVFRSDRDSKNSPTSNLGEKEKSEKTSTKEFSSNGETNSQKKDAGDFIVEHLEVKNSSYIEIDRQIKQDKTLEKAADKLNRSLILPHDIKLRTKDCGEPNAFYDEREHSVTVCYELMDHFYRVFKSVGNSEQKAYDKMFDAVRFAFLHEIGHALIDTYNLPVAGNEEDAADRCSSFINLTELGEDGVNAVLAAADAFALESKRNTQEKRNLADEHLLQEQRFYNSLCMIYGSNTEEYDYIVSEGYLPKARAERCPAEYERTVNSWENLLFTWRKR